MIGKSEILDIKKGGIIVTPLWGIDFSTLKMIGWKYLQTSVASIYMCSTYPI